MKYYLLHVGVGNVGGTLVRQIRDASAQLKRSGTELVYAGLFTDKAGIFNPDGLADAQLDAFPNSTQADVTKSINEVSGPFILIDTTASDKTTALLKQALSRSGAVAMSNKKPISGSLSDFVELHRLGGERLFYETTVGAGLPLISTLKTLLSTGDEVLEIQGCFSGTLGFLFSEIEQGKTFSAAMATAMEQGFTEPDPRDDLSGMDVARKALILSRILGQDIEITDIALEKLYPESMASLSKEEFISALDQLDDKYSKKSADAQSSGKVLRYVATVSKEGAKVGLEAVDATLDIGGLQGPDNIIVFKTKRYLDNPLVVKGPGAGLEVTAAGVFGDILAATRVLEEQQK